MPVTGFAYALFQKTMQISTNPHLLFDYRIIEYNLGIRSLLECSVKRKTNTGFQYSACSR